MFCTRCGKPTENDQPLCNDCLQAMNAPQAQPQQPQYQQPQQPYYAAPQAPIAPVAPVAPANNGLGKGIASNILGGLTCMFIWIIGFNLGFLLAFLFALMFTAPAIISIVTGSKAIKLSKQTNPPFVASRILGIIGLIQGITATVMVVMLPVVGLYNWLFYWL